jgi:hypothetical protein
MRVAVVPDQSIRRIVVSPPLALEDRDAAVGTEPVSALRVEELRADDVARKAAVRRKVTQLGYFELECWLSGQYGKAVVLATHYYVQGKLPSSATHGI